MSSSAQARAQSIAAIFSKTKHVTKAKYGIVRDKYKEIRSEPATTSSPQTYSGLYEVAGMGFTLRLTIGSDATVTGTGTDPLPDRLDISRNFTLRNARIEGALLSATKDYGNGTSEQLEGVFLNSTSFESPTGKGVTTFGIGVVAKPFTFSGVTVDKLFYKRMEKNVPAARQ
ncbi:MAG: hypothetical protein H0U64_08000, partial [Gemmatimonadaceae bacterium]|nr:hypothetical protein [Gemmatimonadaceae bacterium]